MADVAVNDILETRVVCQLDDQIGVNVWHHKCVSRTVVGVPVTIAQVNSQIDVQAAVRYKPALSQSAIYFGCGTRRVFPTISLEDGIATSQGAGTSAFDPLPAQVTGLVAVLTGLGGRANRGRKFLPFPSIAHLAATGKPTGGYQVLILAIGDWFWPQKQFTEVGGSTCECTGVLRHANGTVTTLTSAAARSNWGTQRSRGGYGRPNALPVW